MAKGRPMSTANFNVNKKEKADRLGISVESVQKTGSAFGIGSGYPTK
jgi:hypothetical protein